MDVFDECLYQSDRCRWWSRNARLTIKHEEFHVKEQELLDELLRLWRHVHGGCVHGCDLTLECGTGQETAALVEWLCGMLGEAVTS